MLPPGHIAGGYLAARAFLSVVRPDLSDHQISTLVWIGVFFAFAPDLDMFVSFFRQGAMRLGEQERNHRYLVTHTPIFWLAAGFFAALLLPKPYGWYAGMMVFIGAGSHLLLDSIQFGIRWLYPFTNHVFALRDREVEFHLPPKRFFPHWVEMVNMYMRRFTLTFVCEICVIAAAIIVLVLV